MTARPQQEPSPDGARVPDVVTPDAGAGTLTPERARIAGELNDIVAHAVTALTVCAGAAARQLRDDDRSARASVQAVQAIAGEAMADLRRMQALLHGGPPGYAPQPGLAELAELAAEARRRGVSVEVEVSGDPAAVPSSAAVSVHRIVEAALREASPGGPAIQVTVEAGACALVLRMSPTRPDVLDDARDRVQLHGGRLEHDGRSDLVVTLPLCMRFRPSQGPAESVTSRPSSDGGATAPQ